MAHESYSVRFFFFSSRRRHTRCSRDWSSDVCSSDLHWNDITAYFPEGPTGTDPQTGQPTGVRWVCGTARTDKFGPVDFAVRASDAGEPGTADEFDIQLTQNGLPVYTTFVGTHHQLGGGTGGGGNIQLHKHNESTTARFGRARPALPRVLPPRAL